jgi:hypothetical protein
LVVVLLAVLMVVLVAQAVQVLLIAYLLDHTQVAVQALQDRGSLEVILDLTLLPI